MVRALFINNEKIFDSYMKMAIDEALLLKAVEIETPILRFYEWNKDAVALGYFQSYEQEVSNNDVIDDNIEIFRRLTGGGVVFKDSKGEINYSIVLPEKLLTKNISQSHEQINKAIITGLETLGIKPYHQGINDILLDGKKISGNAQTRRYGGVLQHGTILHTFDTQKMHKYLKIPKEKLEKGVGTISEVLDVSKEEIIEAIKLGFEKEFDLEFQNYELEKEVLDKAVELYDKYKSNDWIYLR